MLFQTEMAVYRQYGDWIQTVFDGINNSHYTFVCESKAQRIKLLPGKQARSCFSVECDKCGKGDRQPCHILSHLVSWSLSRVLCARIRFARRNHPSKWISAVRWALGLPYLLNLAHLLTLQLVAGCGRHWPALGLLSNK